MSEKCIFEATNIKKYFGVTHANENVNIRINGGHIRGLIGENGSGKSTLISIIAGIQSCDSGQMYLNGKEYKPETPLCARDNKIGTVVQELGLVDGLPVGMNLFMGKTDVFKNHGLLDTKKLFQQADELLKYWGFEDIQSRILTENLSVEEKKIVELVRALSLNPELLILDEITQALSLNYRKKLIDIIILLKKKGKAVLLVTHDIEEMVAITDGITVMRDGEIVAEIESEITTPDEIKKLMVGRALEGSYYRTDNCANYDKEVVFEGVDLTSKKFKGVNFQLHKGEILGFTGLSDSGIHELAEAMFAVRSVSNGFLRLPQKNNVIIKSPQQAMNLSMGYVPKDRDKQALMVHDSILNNISLAAVEMTKKRFGFLSPKKQVELSKKAIASFSIKTNGPGQQLRGLSGGNRQKVNLSRWVIQDKEILILDCPTRGVDIGVKSYIYQTMLAAKKNGVSMVLITDELPEVIGMCDTLKIVKDGEIVKTISRGPELSEETIIEVMV